MASAPTSTDIASSLRARIDTLKAELAGVQEKQDELTRVQRALDILEEGDGED